MEFQDDFFADTETDDSYGDLSSVELQDSNEETDADNAPPFDPDSKQDPFYDTAAAQVARAHVSEQDNGADQLQAAVEENEDGPKFEVGFRVDPKLLATALKEATQYLREPSGVLYFAVTDDDSSDLWDDNMIASGLEENEGGRLVIGIHGSKNEGRDLTFVDIPLEAVTQDGVFVMNEGDKLAAWAKHCSDTVEVKFMRHDMKAYLQLETTSSVNKLPLPLVYLSEEDVTEHFPHHTDRFTTPTTGLASPIFSNMLQRASKVAPTGLTQVGDLIWRSESREENGFAEGKGYIEFDSADRTSNETHTIAAVHKVMHNSPYDYEWSIASEHLKALAYATNIEGSTYQMDDGIREVVDDEGELVMVEDSEGNERVKTYWIGSAIQIAYSRSLDKLGGGTMHVHRQIATNETEEVIKRWVEGDRDDTRLFEHPFSRLFATVPTHTFFTTLKRIWALQPSAIVDLELSADEEGSAVLNLLSGDPNNRDSNFIPASHGESQLPKLMIHSKIISSLETMIGDASSFQIRTFPKADSLVAEVQPADGTSVDEMVELLQEAFPHEEVLAEGDKAVITSKSGQCSPSKLEAALGDKGEIVTLEGEELNSSMILVPLPPGADPEELYNTPDRYMMVYWS